MAVVSPSLRIVKDLEVDTNVSLTGQILPIYTTLPTLIPPKGSIIYNNADASLRFSTGTAWLTTTSGSGAPNGIVVQGNTTQTALAPAVGSLAVGNFTNASGLGSVAVGSGNAASSTTASGAGAISIGGVSGSTTAVSSTASGAQSIAIGEGSSATNRGALASASGAIAIGGGFGVPGAVASGVGAVALGTNAQAVSASDLALGHSAATVGAGTNRIVIGESGTASGTGAINVGTFGTASGANAYLFGSGALNNTIDGSTIFQNQGVEAFRLNPTATGNVIARAVLATVTGAGVTLTAAQVIGGAVATTTAGNTAFTLPTAATLDTALQGPGVSLLYTGMMFYCTVYPTTANQISFITAAGITLLGVIAPAVASKACILTFIRTGAGAWTVTVV